MIFLVLLTISSVFLGLCASDDSYETVCHGRSYRFPRHNTIQMYMGKLYLTPSDGGPRRLLLDKSKPISPRIKMEGLRFVLQDVKTEDEGYFSLETNQKIIKIATIKVSVCAEEITKHYGEALEYRLSSQAYYLEFSLTGSPSQSITLWNASDPTVNVNSRGRLDYYSWKMTDVTQSDSGFYNFRNRDNVLTERLHLTVKEHVENLHLDEDDLISIVYPSLSHMRTVIYTPDLLDDHITIIKYGRTVGDYWFSGKLQVVTNGIEVFRAEGKDTGTFEFMDAKDNLIMTVRVVVNDYYILDVIHYSSVGMIIPASVIFCCCYCCIKKRYKGSRFEPRTAAAPAQNEPAAPSYSTAPYSSAATYRPVNVPKANVPQANIPKVNVPAATSSNSPAYQPVRSPVKPTQPEVAPPAKQEPPIGSNFLSSDIEPTFELKGVTFPSGSLLGSDSTASDVYTSDKLNFL